jgi:hypothetical protein
MDWIALTNIQVPWAFKFKASIISLQISFSDIQRNRQLLHLAARYNTGWLGRRQVLRGLMQDLLESSSGIPSYKQKIYINNNFNPVQKLQYYLII